jgi:hypothetical protein
VREKTTFSPLTAAIYSANTAQKTCRNPIPASGIINLIKKK